TRHSSLSFVAILIPLVYLFLFSFYSSRAPRDLHSFPTRRSSDLFPADFICEALYQTRGWFYSLLAVSTLLFDRSAYRNVLCLGRSEEHTSELQSRGHLVCRLLLEKKKKKKK